MTGRARANPRLDVGRGGPPLRTRRALLAALGLLPLALRAGGAPTRDADPAHQPLRRDPDGRVRVRALVDGAHDCEFVLDTAATRSALTPDAAERLGLRALPGDGVLVHGTTGVQRLPLVRVASLVAGDARLLAANVALLARYAVPGADGLLGTDALTGCTLVLDFARGTLALERTADARDPDAGAPAASRARATPLAAIQRLDGAIAIPVRVGARTVSAIVDTGSAQTLGTRALAALCGPPHGVAGERRGTIRGVDRGVGTTRACVLPRMELGSVRIARVAVSCGEFAAFDPWQLAEQPALLLGMDVLGRLAELRIDFASGAVTLA